MWITAIFLLVFLLMDQVSKYWVDRFYGVDATIFEIPNFVRITKVYNPGAAFGLGDEYTWVLVIISFIATIILAFLCTKINWKHGKAAGIGITMALAGCIGNFIDRSITWIGQLTNRTYLRPGVVDMISFKPWDWLTNLVHAGSTIFNVADVFLIIGIIIYVVDYIFFYEKRVVKYGKN